MDIAHQFQQVGICIDEQRLVTPLEYMAGTGLAVIDPLRVTLGDVLHDAGKRDCADLYHQMDVVGHQAEGVDTAVEFFHRPLQEERQPQPVAVIEEYLVTGVTAQDDVIDGAGIMDAGFTCHRGNVSVNSRKSSLTPETLTPETDLTP